MAHINQRLIGPYHWRRDGNAESVITEYPVGKVATVSSCPYIYKIIESNAVPEGNGMFEISLLVEPASPEEAGAYLGWDWSTNNADREDQAAWTALELQQKSWHSGIPADATIFCVAHQKVVSAHGANHYGDALVCNECVSKIELAIAREAISDPQVWIKEFAAISVRLNTLDEIEAYGHGSIQLGERRYLEILVLYEFIKNSEYKADAHIEAHYPYEDMVPSLYKGYIREDWEPGEYFSSPVRIIIFTNRNKLMDFLESGKLPTKERKKLPMGRPTQERTERIQWTSTPELKLWIESQATGNESMSDVIYRLISSMREM